MPQNKGNKKEKEGTHMHVFIDPALSV